MTYNDKSEGFKDLKSQDEGVINDVSSLDHILRDIDSGEINELAVVAEGEERTTWFVWILVMCSTISGLLFGESIEHLLINMNGSSLYMFRL